MSTTYSFSQIREKFQELRTDVRKRGGRIGNNGSLLLSIDEIDEPGRDLFRLRLGHRVFIVDLSQPTRVVLSLHDHTPILAGVSVRRDDGGIVFRTQTCAYSILKTISGDYVVTLTEEQGSFTHLLEV